MSNEEIIYSLVEKHFSLSEKCLPIFKDYLFENKSDPFIRSILGKDLRARYELPVELMEQYDDGWELFKKLKSFIEEKEITYEDFLNGKTKNQEKIFKQAIKYYTNKKELFSYDLFNGFMSSVENSFVESYLKILSEHVGSMRLPKTRMQLVASANFADWFLCSTAEKWSSCLSLESTYAEAYWSGLPGTIVDPNRLMFYLTDGQKKNYLGVETDRFVGRCWAMLDEKNVFNINKFYPVDSLNVDIIKACTNIPVRLIDDGFKAKTSFYPIRNKKGYTVFIYIDKGKLEYEKDGLFTITGTDGRGGMFGYDTDNVPSDGTIINYSNGLSGLVEDKEELEDHYTPLYVCEQCGVAMTEDELHWIPSGDFCYCSDCFYERYFYCDYCGGVHYRDDSCYVYNNHGDCVMICEGCFDEHATVCEKCGEAFYDSSSHSCG